jgi:probable HAF family extracellular repeat protein
MLPRDLPERGRSAPASAFRWYCRRGLALLLGGLALLLAAAARPGVAAAPASYNVQDLGTLPGLDASVATDINNQGTAVGFSYFPSARQAAVFNEGQVAVRFSQGQVTDLNQEAQVPPGFFLVAAGGINDRNQIVGIATDDEGNTVPFLLTGGGVTLIPELTAAYDINNSGQIVGVAADENGETFAALWENGQVTNLNKRAPANSGLPLAEADSINDQGQVVGRSEYEDGEDFVRVGFLLDPDGSLTELGDLLPAGINNQGQIVGENQYDQALLFENGKKTVLDSLVPFRVFIVALYGINDNGLIVGYGDPGDLFEHALLLSPGTGGSGVDLEAAFTGPVTVRPLLRSGLGRGRNSSLQRIFGSQLQGSLQVSNPREERFSGGLVRFYLSEDEELGPGDRLLQSTPVVPIGGRKQKRVRCGGVLRGRSLKRGIPDVGGRFVIAVVTRNGKEAARAVSRPIQ